MSHESQVTLRFKFNHLTCFTLMKEAQDLQETGTVLEVLQTLKNLFAMQMMCISFLIDSCNACACLYLCNSLAVAVAGGRLKAGARRHAERKRECTGGEGQECEGCAHISLCEMAAADSRHPLRWCSVLRHQCCMFVSAFSFTTKELKTYLS